MRNFAFIIAVFSFCILEQQKTYSQGASINASGVPPDPSAMFDVGSTTKGVLMPRMTTAQRDSISNPVEGLTIYNLDCHTYNYYNGTSWAGLNGPPVIVSIIANPSGAICLGTSVSFTATAINGGTAPAYQWQVNGHSVGTDSSAYTYTPSNGDIVTCVLTSNLSCVSGSPATSNAITEIVNALPVAAINPSSISSCSSSGPDTLTASGGGTYLWNTSATSNSISVSPNTNTNYSITVTSAQSCTATASASITIQNYSVPITLTNSSTQSTGTGFQQMITVNSSTYSAYENSSLQNVEFTTGPGATGTPLQAWIESGASNSSTSTVYWVNLGSTAVGGNSSLTIYMNFMAGSVMSASGPTGEAPQLSGSYAQYDNGALVFSDYQAWGGLSAPPSGWGVYSNPTIKYEPTYTEIDGIANTQQGFQETNNTTISLPFVFEFYGEAYTPYGAAWLAYMNYGFATNYYLVGAAGGNYLIGSAGVSDGDGASCTTNLHVFSGFYSSGAGIGELDYTPFATLTGVTTNSPGLLGFEVYGSSSVVQAYWNRQRVYPPSGAMPGVSFGAGECQ